jgi:hypothetical protein
MAATPRFSVATQNELDGQATDENAEPLRESTAVALDHELPLKVNSFWYRSTARQNEADAQDTRRSYRPKGAPSMFVDPPHELPLYLTASPASPTATQKLDETHDSDVGESSRPAEVGALQELPLYVNALPPLLMAAQNDEDGHETETRLVPLERAAALDHELPL